MNTFQLHEKVNVVCQSENTRYGFRHLATLFYENQEHCAVKCCYYNRTWESYQYQSVLYAAIRKAKLPKDIQESCTQKIRDYQEPNNNTSLRTVCAVGELICNTDEEKNNWKIRMIKAAHPGINIPETWNTLPETEKKERLNQVIATLQETKEAKP